MPAGGTGLVFTVSENSSIGEYDRDTITFKRSKAGNFANIKAESRAEKDSIKSNSFKKNKFNDKILI